jgi:hypothetical protein
MGKIVDRLMLGRATVRQLRDCGVSKDRLYRLLGILASEKRVEFRDITVKGNATREYWLRT